MTKFGLGAGGALVACLLAASAHAQITFQPSTASFGAQMGGQVLSIQRHSLNQGARSPSTGVHSGSGWAAPRSANTSYRADPAVAARVRQQFLDFVAQTSGRRGAQDVGAAFARTDPIATWARQAAPDGMRLGDVADAMAEYWVQNWLMANRLTDAPPGRVRDVRDQVRRTLAVNPAFARLDNAQRQEMAEVFIYNTILQGSIYMDAQHAHNQALLEKVSDAAVARFRNEAHIDLRAVTLTPAGLAPKA